MLSWKNVLNSKNIFKKKYKNNEWFGKVVEYYVVLNIWWFFCMGFGLD